MNGRRRTLGALACVLTAPSGVAASPVRQTQRTKTALDEPIHRASAYLHAQIGADGRFVYRRDARTGSPIDGGYNLLRHAGTLFALACYHLEFPPDARQAANAMRSIGYLRSCCFAPSLPDVDDLALWSYPGIVGGRRRRAVAKLGGAALALLALAKWRAIEPGAASRGELWALGRFILSMLHDDGRLDSLHTSERNAPRSAWQSLYYPGQAVLGLLHLFEIDGNAAWLRAAIDALRYLARTRELDAAPPPDHWTLMAMGRMWSLEPSRIEAAMPPDARWAAAETTSASPTFDPASPLSSAHLSEVLLSLAGRTARVILDEQVIGSRTACESGGFAADGRVTPTATRLEGLIPLLSFMPPGALASRIRSAVDQGMVFLVAAQARAGPGRGGFTRITPTCESSDARATEVRIDYVQHALGAMLAYRSLGGPASPLIGDHDAAANKPGAPG